MASDSSGPRLASESDATRCASSCNAEIESPMTAKVLTRAELPDSHKCDLTHLFAGTDKWAEDFAWLQRTYSQIDDSKGCLGKSATSLAGCLEFEKSLDLKIER